MLEMAVAIATWYSQLVGMSNVVKCGQVNRSKEWTRLPQRSQDKEERMKKLSEEQKHQIKDVLWDTRLVRCRKGGIMRVLRRRRDGKDQQKKKRKKRDRGTVVV
jgi:hypothetical protein